jgi:glycerol-3-phosphate dehydrogenase (NAD(P)+)
MIGDGAMAITSATLLAENGHAVRLFSPFPEWAEKLSRTRTNERSIAGHPLPESVEVTGEDSLALAGAELAVTTTPVQLMRSIWQRLARYCPRNLPVCSVAKGIENTTLLTPTQVVRDVLDGRCDSPRPVAMLSGPCIAPEVAGHLPATVTVASQSAALAARVQELFSRPYFRVYTNSDLVGTEVAAASKNVIAIAAGVLDGLAAGDNAKAALITRGLSEITRLGQAAGGRAETFAGLAGVGDLVTTCISPLGRNRSFGEAIGRGLSVEQALAQVRGVVEGVATTLSVVELARRFGVEMPITQAIHEVLFRGKAPAEAIADLMKRPLKSES